MEKTPKVIEITIGFPIQAKKKGVFFLNLVFFCIENPIVISMTFYDFRRISFLMDFFKYFMVKYVKIMAIDLVN